MFTNISKHGGNFRTVIDREFKVAENVTIASGYTSIDMLYSFRKAFVEIARKGGVSRLMLGMAFYEGLSQKKLDVVSALNEELIKFNNHSGVYVANGRRYHGKVYYFSNKFETTIYVGSSNFSASGTKGNIECIVPILDRQQKLKISKFLDDLYSKDYAVLIHQAKIIVPNRYRVIQTGVRNKWQNLQRFDPSKIKTGNLPKFIFPLERVVDKPKSNLNIYFGKGRWNKLTGKVTPRPWYEIELIADNTLNSQPNYPKGDFSAYTDDGYIIPMRTQGDYQKNIRSRKSLQLFGFWLKGKLEKSGVLKKYQPVTIDTLEEYGNDKIIFYKMGGDKYFMKF